jgi:pSer/pThr/pTyr-binding forkhead associated (FHA) protein/tetratricopeptide (TPR) repeat protein
MHKLLIEDDEGKTVAVPLIREEITIGRTDGNTIRLTEQNVSRKHARLTLRGGVLRIEDLGSYNGTRLNGSTLSGVSPLKDGDVILIGDYRLGIQEELASSAKSSESAAPAAAPSPVVEEAMDGQPTIPVSTMMAQAALAQTPFAEPPARLVVASRFMAGTEFVLDRPSQVLGRTPENDMVLNHKSISRHHAKIVHDGSRYVILDLESANGVRVGGAEVDRTELQSGDVIELGEVRLRFLSGDSALDEASTAWYQNKKVIAVGLAGTAVGVVLLLVFAFAGGHKAPVVASAPAEPKPMAAPVAPAMPPVVQPTPPTPPPSEEPKATEPAEPAVPIAELLADAKKKAHAEKWEDALALIAKVLAQEPASAEATTLSKAIEAEKQYSEKMVTLKQAMANKDFDAVLQGTWEIPEESMYKPRAIELHKNAQTQFVALHLQAATSKLAANECDDARREAELVLGLEARNKKAAAVVKRCEALAAKAAAPEPVAKPEPATKPEPAAKPAPVVAAAKPAPRPKAVSAPAREPKPAKSVEPAKAGEPAASAADSDKLIREAQQAWLRGQYGAAIDSARKALRAKPGLTNAYQIIAVCSCALHDAESAAKAVERLDDRNKQFVKSACQKNGISF